MSPLPIIHRIFQSFLLAFLALVCGAAWSQVVPGYDGGTFLMAFPDGPDSAHRVVFQPDGKYIVVGQAWFGNQQFAMTRFNANGTIDTSYGANHNGTQLEPIGSGNAEGMAAAFDASGKLVVAGHVKGTDNRDRFAIARFNADGTLDLTFGGGGSEVALGTGDAGGTTMAIQSTGRILVGGYSIGSGGHRVFTVLAYTPTDIVDTTYGVSGSYIAADTGSHLTVNAMALLANDKVLIAGGAGKNMIIQRLNADGSLDTTFGTGGTTTVAGAGVAGGIAVYADGRIGVAGAWTDGTGSKLNVVRLSADGVLDATYGTSGLASITGGLNGLSSTGLVVQSDGSAVVAGDAPTGGGNRVLIAKFTPTGAIDTTFGTGGTGQTVFIAQGDSNPRDLVARPTGGFFVPGSDSLPTSSTLDSLVVAFNAAGAVDTTFNGTGFALVDVGHSPAAASASALQSDGKLVAVGRICGSNACSLTANTLDKSVVVRYLANGSLDTTFGAGKGYVTIPGMFSATAVAIDSSQRIVVGGMGQSTFNSSPAISMAFARLTSAGAMDATFHGGTAFVVQANTPHEEITSIALQSGTGRIIGAGWVKPTTWMDSAFVGVTSGGSLDTSFGTGGETVVAVSTGDDSIAALAFDTAGKIIGAGSTELVSTNMAFAATRLTANGVLDTTFGSPNGYAVVTFPNNAQANAVAMQGNNIVLGGSTFSSATSTDDFALARLTPTGALDTTFNGTGQESDDYNHNHNRIFSLAILPNGKILGVGDNFGFFGLVQFLPNGGLDTSFGTGGSTALRVNFMAGADHAYSVNVTPDGSTIYLAGNASNAFGTAIVSASGGGTLANANIAVTSSNNPSTSGQSVTLTATLSGSSGTPSGTVTFNDNGTAIGACSALTLAGGVAQCPTSSLATGSHSITVAYSGDGAYASGTSGAFTQTVNAQSTGGALALNPTSLDFGGESMNTTSPGQSITVTNTGGTTVTVSGVAVTSQFAQSNNCSTLAAGASCTVTVTFAPAIAAGAVNSKVAVNGTLTISSNAAGNPNTAPLSGTAEKSLVAHYYRSILRRAPDQAGHDFWESEAARVVSLGANVNETWYALAMSFFNTPEYANFHTDNAGFLTDLYLTFFNRTPDTAGFNFWMDQMNQGMPRDGVLANMMFSPEFKNFTEAIFGNSTVRAEVDMAMDMYRGTLARLPDSAGFNFYLGEFRKAQCQSADAVRSEANTVSSGFLNSQEYGNRQRTNAQYMADLYNTFMRRGPDTAGINFYIGQLDSGAQTREAIRQQFVASPEFSNRVTNVANAGCTQ